MVGVFAVLLTLLLGTSTPRGDALAERPAGLVQRCDEPFVGEVTACMSISAQQGGRSTGGRVHGLVGRRNWVYSRMFTE
jgi:hypothetical protein